MRQQPQQHACLCLRDQRVDDRHAHGARADDEVIGLDGLHTGKG